MAHTALELTVLDDDNVIEAVLSPDSDQLSLVQLIIKAPDGMSEDFPETKFIVDPAFATELGKALIKMSEHVEETKLPY